MKEAHYSEGTINGDTSESSKEGEVSEDSGFLSSRKTRSISRKPWGSIIWKALIRLSFSSE